MAQARVYGLGGYGRGKPVNANSPSAPGGFDEGGVVIDGSKMKFTKAKRTDPRFDHRLRIEVEAMKMTQRGLYCSYAKVCKIDSYLSDFFGKMTYVENPNYFCIQSKTQARWVERHEQCLHDAIEDEDADGDLKLHPQINYTDTACAVMYEGKWRRGYVMRTNWNTWPDTKRQYLAEINLVDTGYYGFVRLKEMRELPDRWLRAPPMTYRARLEGDSIDTCSDRWPDKIIAEFRKMVDNEVLTCVFRNTQAAMELRLRQCVHNCEKCEKTAKGQCTINDVVTRMVEEWKQEGDYSRRK